MNINIEIPKELHTKAKTKAYQKGMLLKYYIIEAIKEKAGK